MSCEQECSHCRDVETWFQCEGAGCNELLCEGCGNFDEACQKLLCQGCAKFCATCGENLTVRCILQSCDINCKIDQHCQRKKRWQEMFTHGMTSMADFEMCGDCAKLCTACEKEMCQGCVFKTCSTHDCGETRTRMIQAPSSCASAQFQS